MIERFSCLHGSEKDEEGKDTKRMIDRASSWRATIIYTPGHDSVLRVNRLYGHVDGETNLSERERNHIGNSSRSIASRRGITGQSKY